MTSRDRDALHPPPRIHRSKGAIAALLSLSLAACGETGSDDVPVASGNASAAAAVASAQASQSGSFEIGGTTYPFRVVRCDLTGEIYEGMILQGAGTAPDGRQLAVSVDRTGSDMVTENAFIALGSLQDGDNWSATRTRLQNGRWFADEAATEPADGPLINTTGNELSVEAIFHRESDDASEQGVLRAACPS